MVGAIIIVIVIIIIVKIIIILSNSYSHSNEYLLGAHICNDTISQIGRVALDITSLSGFNQSEKKVLI